MYARLDGSRGERSPSTGGIVSVRAEAFSGGQKIGQSLGTFHLPMAGDSTAYMALLCIDARAGAPFVVAESTVSSSPPASCG